MFITLILLCKQTVQICLDVVAQREKYSGEILAAARQAVEDGSPVNRPIWWTAPNDTVTHIIGDGKLFLVKLSRT